MMNQELIFVLNSYFLILTFKRERVTMQRLYIVLPVVYHGTLAGDGTFGWKAAFECSLWHVSAVAENNSDATLKFGTNSDDDEIMTATAIGDNGAPAEFTS